MNPPAMLKWSYALTVGIIVLFSVQSAMYVAHSLRFDGPECVTVTLIGAGLVIGYMLIQVIWRFSAQAFLTWKWQRHFRSNENVKLTKRLAYKYRTLGTEILVVNDDGFTALALGMRRPIIVISKAVLDLFDEDEVKAILLHEWHHCRNRDNAKLFLARLLTEAFGYLPISRPFFRYYQTWTELLADRFAIRRMGTELPLASVLLKLTKLGDRRRHSAAVYFATTLDYRIAQVLEPDKNVKVKAALFRPLLVSVALLLLLTMSGDA